MLLIRVYFGTNVFNQGHKIYAASDASCSARMELV